MQEMMGVILTEDKARKLGCLTDLRSVSAVPFAGRYRLIDFVLSNLANSGITNIGIATQYNYSSLMDHVGAGKPWDLSRKNGGLVILPPYSGKENIDSMNGDIDVLYGIGGYLRKNTADYVVLTNGHFIFNSTFNDALKFHKDKNANITVLYKEAANMSESKLSEYTTLEVGADGEITDISKNPQHANSTNISMETFIIERELLINIVADCYAHGDHNFVMDVLIKNLGKLAIYGYKYDGYAASVNSIESYYNASMDFLKPEIRKEIFLSENKIFTKVKDGAPTLYGEESSTKNSLIADGCIIDGEVENSIIFRGVQIKKGSIVKNSIIMQNTVIEENCRVENAIFDKEAVLSPDKSVVGQPNYPFVIAKATNI